MFNHRSTISALRLPCSPLAIARFIVAVIVYSVNRQSVWARSHIKIKILKTILPSVTYPYTTASVISVMLVLWIPASLSHAGPNIVFSCLAPAMSSETVNCPFREIAPTARGGTGLQMAQTGSHLVSAVAVARPFAWTVNVRNTTNCNKSTESFRCNIYSTSPDHAGFTCFTIQAPTTFYFSASYMCQCANNNIPAFTFELPGEVAIRECPTCNNGQPCKYLSNNFHRHILADSEIESNWAKQVHGRALELAQLIRGTTTI